LITVTCAEGAVEAAELGFVVDRVGVARGGIELAARRKNDIGFYSGTGFCRSRGGVFETYARPGAKVERLFDVAIGQRMF
jgi:hypothetical protein